MLLCRRKARTHRTLGRGCSLGPKLFLAYGSQQVFARPPSSLEVPFSSQMRLAARPRKPLACSGDRSILRFQYEEVFNVGRPDHTLPFQLCGNRCSSSVFTDAAFPKTKIQMDIALPSPSCRDTPMLYSVDKVRDMQW